MWCDSSRIKYFAWIQNDFKEKKDKKRGARNVCLNSGLTQKTNTILYFILFFFSVVLHSVRIFLHRSPAGRREWDIQRKLYEKDILSFVLSTWRFHASPASIFTVHRSRTPVSRRSPADRNPTMELGATPALSPFRIKSEKLRGASRRHCVTCRCGSVCGRQRRHDTNSGRLCLCHWIINLHVYRGIERDKCKGEKRAHENNRRKCRETVGSGQRGGQSWRPLNAEE